MASLFSNLDSFQNLFADKPLLLAALIIWTLAWKAFGLWKSARLSHKWWFLAIFILNTAGLLEIGYLYFVARNYDVKVESDESNK